MWAIEIWRCRGKEREEDRSGWLDNIKNDLLERVVRGGGTLDRV